MQIVLDSGKFSDMIRIISMFDGLCNDLIINEGIIRQRSNDKISVFDIDMRPILEEITLPLSNFKQKLELLKTFIGQEVTISANDTDFTIADQHSSLKVKYPNPDFIDNKFITEKDLESVVDTSKENFILETSISKIISERIKTYAKTFNMWDLILVFEGETAKILIETEAKDQSALFLSGIPTNKQLEFYTDVSVIPFIIDHDSDISLNVFEGENEKTLNRFVTTCADVDIKIYCRSLVKERE